MHLKTFKEYPLSEDILKGVQNLGYESPTEVQQIVMDEYLNGGDTVVISQTGSGKTAAFGIPMMNSISWENRNIQALVLVPTRELAQQVQKELFNIGRYKRLNVVSIFGKDSMNRQISDLASRTHVVVGTPGRILDHIDRGTIDLSNVETLILDEADEMMNLGFYDSVIQISNILPKHRSIMLSATLSPKIENIISNVFIQPNIIEVTSEDLLKDRLHNEYVVVDENSKFDDLFKVMVSRKIESAIIFCNRRHRVDEVYNFLKIKNLSVNKIHGNMDQKERSQIMKDFKLGKFRYLVATDVASRGIDVDNVQSILNVDLPDHPETFVHRVGRTARFKENGNSITFIETKQVERFKRDYAPGADRLSYRQIEITDKKRLDFLSIQSIKRERKKADVKFEDIIKIHIKGGKNQKLRAGDVVGAITSISTVMSDDIGVIQVLDDSTYVEILHGKGKEVLKGLEKLPIKGKVRRVGIAYKVD